jgi:hypothetical protein
LPSAAARRVRPVIVRNLKTLRVHAVTAVRHDHQWLILDNRTLIMVPAANVGSRSKADAASSDCNTRSGEQQMSISFTSEILDRGAPGHRPPQLRGAAPSEGLDAGRMNAGESLRDQVGR